jgi:hypothetical protein
MSAGRGSSRLYPHNLCKQHIQGRFEIDLLSYGQRLALSYLTVQVRVGDLAGRIVKM